MSFEVSETQRTPRRSYFQMAARRANGDKVYITGDSRREVEKARSLLMRAARRSGLRMLEVAQMAEVAAIVRENPGVPDCGGRDRSGPTSQRHAPGRGRA